MEKNFLIEIKYVISGEGSLKYVDIIPKRSGKGNSLKFSCNNLLKINLD